MWDLSCRDWEARLLAGQSLIPPLPLFQSEVRDAVAFYDNLRLPDVPGLPRLAEASGQWFRDLVSAIFGSRDPDTNERWIREFFVLAPKGSSKTSYSAAVMLVALLMNQRNRAEFLLIAPTQAIAETAFNQAVGMVQADEELRKRFDPREHLKEIRDRLNHARLKIKTFDPQVLTGTKPVGVLLDELHLIGKIHYAGKVMTQIRGGLEKSAEGFLVITTTQADEPPAGVFKDELMLARQVRDGKVRARRLPMLYEFPASIASNRARWEDPSLWHLVNPNLGRSVQLPSLIKLWDEEKQKGEAAVKVWASQHLNIEVGVGIGDGSWAGATFWESAADKTLDLETLLARSDVAVVGIDGGGLDDLLGLVVLGRDRDTRCWLWWAHAWARQCVLERRPQIASALEGFARDGNLTIVPTNSEDDVAGVADYVMQVEESGLLPEKNAIGVDQVGISDILDELDARGFDVSPEAGRVVGIRQGWSLTNTIKTTERRLATGGLKHDGSALMAFAVSNAKVEPRGNSILITKQAAGSAKIDPLVAGFNAAALMSKTPEASPMPEIIVI